MEAFHAGKWVRTNHARVEAGGIGVPYFDERVTDGLTLIVPDGHKKPQRDASLALADVLAYERIADVVRSLGDLLAGGCIPISGLLASVLGQSLQPRQGS